MKNYKAMIFDLDGTLLNTIDDLKNAINYAFNHNGIVTDLSIAEVKTFIGKERRPILNITLCIEMI